MRTFRIEFNTDNSAFDPDMVYEETDRILRHIHREYSEDNKMNGYIMDINGNRIGKWSHE